MEKEKCKQKMLLAVVQGDDYPETVDDLNRHGFFATVLSSTGGFLKKRSVTLMIGVEEHRVEAAQAVRGTAAADDLLQSVHLLRRAQPLHSHDAGAYERGRRGRVHHGPG